MSCRGPTAVASGSILLHRLLAWVLAARDDAAAIHFDVVPSALARLVIGLALWRYHRVILRETEVPSHEGWSSPERIYRYLVAGAGMITTARGIATVLMVGLDLAVPGRTLVQAPGGTRDVIAVRLLCRSSASRCGLGSGPRSSITSGRSIGTLDCRASGADLRRIRGGHHHDGRTLSILLFELFDALLAGMLTADLIEEQRWSISLLLTAGAISPLRSGAPRGSRGGA